LMALCEVPCSCQRSITVVWRAFKWFFFNISGCLKMIAVVRGELKHREFDKWSCSCCFGL
jgi:hypothetical protein